MPDPYQLDLTAAQVNQAINAAYDSDQPPAAGDTNLVNSDKIAAYVSSAVGAEATARATVASDLAAVDGRVTALEGAATSVATFTKASGSSVSTVFITGYTETDPDGIASESSGTVTVTGSGVYLLFISGEYTESDSSNADYFTVEYRVNSSTVDFSKINEETYVLNYSSVVTSAGSFTVDIRLIETNYTSVSYSNVAISIVKLL